MASGFNAPTPARIERQRLLFATLVAMLVVLLNIAFGGRISNLVRDIVTPVSNAGERIGAFIADSGYFTSRRALESQISQLQSEVQQEQLQAAAFAALQQQNASLAALEHLSQTAPGLVALITSSVISSPYGTFSVGVGSADGVSQGALALTAEGFVIGRVVQVQTNQSLVDELFASNVQTAVTVDGAAAVAMGQGGEAMAEVPHGIAVSDGDPVVAPEYGGRSIGTVAHVDTNPANAQEAVYISLPVSLASLQYVYITP